MIVAAAAPVAADVALPLAAVALGLVVVVAFVAAIVGLAIVRIWVGGSSRGRRRG